METRINVYFHLQIFEIRICTTFGWKTNYKEEGDHCLNGNNSTHFKTVLAQRAFMLFLRRKVTKAKN